MITNKLLKCAGMDPKQVPQTHGKEERYIPALDGIRGYAFLLVFCAHYLLPSQLADPGSAKYKLICSLFSPSLFALPAFFVLSGFLIGGILYNTRNREGYFKIFYGRRVLRIFPVYYGALLAIYIFYRLHGIVPNYRFWVHWLYIQNLLPGYTLSKYGPVGMLHFWSLAVEEQFYMLWPLAVWLFPEKPKLLKISTGLFLGSLILRAAAPVLIGDAERYAYFTPTCVGPILLGVVLSLIYGDKIYRKSEWAAKWIVLCGLLTTMVLSGWKGQEWKFTFWGEEIRNPLTSIFAFALVVAIQQEGSILQRIFSVRWAGRLGKMSYSAYVIHLLFASYFFHVVSIRLSAHMRPALAVIASAAGAFCLTMILAMLSGIFVEGPALRFKRKLRYGAEHRPNAGSGASDELLPSAAN